MIQANDPQGISKIELFADRALVGSVNLSPNDPNPTVYFAWNTTGIPNGKHMLEAKATTAAGTSQSAYVTVTSHNYSISVPTGNVIAINPFLRHQTMKGWEAVAQAGQLESPGWNNYKNNLMDLAVNDLGINRLRLEIKSGAENPTDYYSQWRAGQITLSQYGAKQYEIINDNSDPNSVNPNGFKWAALDDAVNDLILPMRQRLQARGETLWVNVNYVDFGASTFEHKDYPAEYAEFVLAAYQHMQSTFGFVPDSWEVVLEPDHAAWNETHVAQAIKAAGDRLVANGFVPSFTAPSTTNAELAPVYIDRIASTAGAMQYVKEFSYHRYCCVTDSVLQQIFNRTVLYNKQAAMLEWIGGDQNTLHQDIKQGRNSSWQQYTLAFPGVPDNGAQYYVVNDSNPTNPVIALGSRTKFLRQYFKFIRNGAKRIDALTGNTSFDPLAFINTNGKYVVVVKAAVGGSFNILNLPPGTYGIKYTTGNQYDVNATDVIVGIGQPLSANIPAAGVITIFAR